MTSPNPIQAARFEFVQHVLERRHAYMAAAVMRLGTVTFTEVIETAAIMVSGKQVKLWFNQRFFDSINNMELAAVLVHEALHFLLSHQERAAKLRRQADRFLFDLACEAVVNDLIVACFKDFVLPGNPVTGRTLVGRAVHDRSAEEVLEMLRAQGEASATRHAGQQTLDDHSIWSPEQHRASLSGWSEETHALLHDILRRLGRRDPCYGMSPLGIRRPVPAVGRRVRKDLTRFLTETLWLPTQDETVWTRPDPRLVSVYPAVVLPACQERPEWEILIAIDTSGSVPSSFLAAARQVASQKIPNAKVTLISFDTVSYKVAPGAASLKGGGGTRVQAVEEYATERMSRYPDHLFVLTDGLTPAPTPRHPGRWVWILPPWGSTDAIPKCSRKEFFDLTK